MVREAIGGEYAYLGGDGGLKRNFYVSGPKRVFLDGVSSHSSRGHSLKLVIALRRGEEQLLRSSDIDPAILDAPESIRQPCMSVHLLDIAANTSYDHGNTFKN